MENKSNITRIPVFDNIRIMSKEDFDKLSDKTHYRIISKDKNGNLTVGHCMLRKNKNPPTVAKQPGNKRIML